jgi:predicted DNA-binding antitoxin AbrB/MazE fold protein
MTVAVEAIYEDGVLKLEGPVGLKEHSKVRVIIEEEAPRTSGAADEDPTGWKAARQFIGLWKDAPAGERIAEEHDKYLYK